MHHAADQESEDRLGRLRASWPRAIEPVAMGEQTTPVLAGAAAPTFTRVVNGERSVSSGQALDGKEVLVEVDRWLRPFDWFVHRLDRLSGLRARRQQRAEDAAAQTRFAYELGRWVGPVADRCGYGGPQIGGTSVTFCGDPAEVLARHPWVDGDAHTDHIDLGHCVDLQVGWRDGWVELRAEPFVRHTLLAPAPDVKSLGPALRDVAQRLAGGLDDQAVVQGTSPLNDPRPPDGSRDYLRG